MIWEIPSINLCMAHTTLLNYFHFVPVEMSYKL